MSIVMILSILAALIPALLYGVIFYWLDRYEREPLWLVIAAFLWGAVPAVLISLVGEVWLGTPLIGSRGTFSENLISGSIIAPIIEEVVKGAALLVIFLLRRQEFDGPLDGIVYGSMIGLGFGMTENFFYFADAAEAGGLSQLGLVIFLRAVIFGLNHACYTGMVGIGFGLARNVSRSQQIKRLSYPLWGLIVAILIHSLHNFGATTASYNVMGLFLSLVIAITAILLLFITILYAWRFEYNCIRDELVGEIGYLLNANEYKILTQNWFMPLRSQGKLARAEAKRRHLLVELALHKYRLRNLGYDQEPELAAEVLRLRTQLASLTANNQ